MDAERTKVYVDYKRLKNSCIAGYVPSLVFLRDSIDKPHFEETLEKFVNLSKAVSEWLLFTKRHMKVSNIDLKKEAIEKIIKDTPKSISHDNKEEITNG